jgi:hypothetical protein
MFESISTEEEPTNKYFYLRPSATPVMTPQRHYGLPTVSTAPVVEWAFPEPKQLADHFRKNMHLEEIWNYIRRSRLDQRFKQDQIIYYRQGIPMVIPIDPIVYQEIYTDFANFYGIPWEVMSMYLSAPPEEQKAAEDALWKNVISPFNAMLPEAFEQLKPRDLPGYFNASFREPSGQYWLNYIEPLFVKPKDPEDVSGA